MNWKRLLLSCSTACSLACGDSDPGGVELGDAGNAVVDGGSVRDSGATSDSSTRRDSSVPRDSSTVTPGDAGDEEETCGVLMAQVRDFTPSTHPDFEKFNGSGTTGIVQSMLDADHLPVLAATKSQVTSAESFNQWYRNVPDVNIQINVPIALTELGNNEFAYESSSFFPVDDKGFGDFGSTGHNFHFTTQIPTKFTYQGGEKFEFEGDDDLWIFVNDRLALDLGGLHSALKGTIDFDAKATELGIQIGKTYRMDIFHAERHTTQSNFKIRTTIACFKPVFLI